VHHTQHAQLDRAAQVERVAAKGLHRSKVRNGREVEYLNMCACVCVIEI
jgi:hypothetical protein